MASGSPSQVEHPGEAVVHEAGALDVAAHGAQIPMAGVAHDVRVAHALAVRPPFDTHPRNRREGG